MQMRCSLTRATADDAMACDRLADGIRRFSRDIEKLEAIVKQRMRARASSAAAGAGAQ